MIFCLHGNIGSPTDFDFLDDFDIEKVDLWQFSHLSLNETGNRVNQLASQSKRRGIVGYSMGGRIALHAICSAPDFWDFAIIISANPGIQSAAEKSERLNKDREWANTLRSSSWNDFLKQWNSQSVLKGPAPESQIELERYSKNISSGFENWSLGKQDDLREAIEKSTTPITWVVGETDVKYVSLANEIKELRPDIDLITVPNCGHRVVLEAVQTVRKIVVARVE